MTKIKNGAKLVKRAKDHARRDHIQQRTYGSGVTNGKTEYEGCAIACLGMPGTLTEIKAFVRALLAEQGDDNPPAGEGQHDQVWKEGDEIRFEFGRQGHLDRMHEEFGIVDQLATLGEALFEAQPYHGGAIEFVVTFAKAVAKAEGREINNKMVLDAWETITGIEPRYWGPETEPQITWNALQDDMRLEELERDLLHWVETGEVPAIV
jgi:hypothetical protein